MYEMALTLIRIRVKIQFILAHSSPPNSAAFRPILLGSKNMPCILKDSQEMEYLLHQMLLFQ